MNKKGWIRIVEAVIAVLLIATVLLTVYSRQASKTQNEEIISTISAILDGIVNDNRLRQDVLNYKAENINSFVRERLPAVLDFTVKICDVNDVCGPDVYRKEVFADERIVSSTLQEYDATKLKLFVWEKS